MESLFDGDADSCALCYDSVYQNVKLHFNQVMEVNSVNVYALNDPECAPEAIEVYASMDGINYDLVTTKALDVYDTTDDVEKYAIKMPGTVYARDMKIVVCGADNSSIKTYPEVHEIEAFGRPIQAERVRATSYSYDDEVPFVTEDDILSQDTQMTALSDGLSAQVSTSGDYLSVIYDLGKFCQVDEIKIKGNHGGFELLTSPDGFTYFSSAYYEAASGESIAYGRAENNAKFVKIVFHKPESSNIILSEIELYTRALKDQKATKVPLRATLKPNNLVYLDWSDHNANGEQKTYNVYIEENYFTNVTGLSPKPVQTGFSNTTYTDVKANFAVYAGLKPETDYYIAVTEKGITGPVEPIRITSYDTLGGDSAAAIFGVNEYDGGSYIMSGSEVRNKLTTGDWEKLKLWEGDNITQEELNALPEEGNADAKVRKLLGDIESVQKNRHFYFEENRIRNYVAHGISWLPQGPSTADSLQELGIYTFGHTNEPEISATYNGNRQKFGTEFDDSIKQAYETVHTKSPEYGVLYSPTLCGTDKYTYLDALYEYNSDMGDYYDVLDVHMYNKGIGDPAQEYITGAERTDVPERVFNKVDLLKGILAGYGDDKPLVSTETGYTDSNLAESHTWGGVMKQMTPEKKAEYVARMYLSNIMAGVEEVYLYAFQDEGYLSNEEVAAGKSYITRVDKGADNAYPDLKTGNSTNYYIARKDPCHEHQFGVVDWYGDPEAGYYSFYTLGKMLRDTYFVESIDTPDLIYGAVFYDKLKDKYLTALWEISGNGAMINVASDEDKLTRIDMYGGVTEVTPGTMALTTAPFYLYSDEPLSVGLKSRKLISGNGYGSADNNIATTYDKLGYNVTIANSDATISATNMPSDSNPDSMFAQGKLGIASYPASDCIWSNWGANTSVITVDLGKEFTVDGVDASAYSESANQHFTKIKIEVSKNGTDYDVVVPEKTLVDGVDSFIISGDISSKYERLSVNEITPVKAQYVRVTMTGGTYQIIPNEVLVFGK